MRTTGRKDGGWAARLRRARGSRWGRLGLDLLLFAVALSVAGALQARGNLGAGSPPPVAALPALDGKPVDLAAYRGRPLLLAFWAPWCTVCKAEAQNLRWVQRLAGDRARVVTVAASFEQLDSVRAFAREHELAGPVLLADDAAVHAFQVSAFPTVYFLGADGRVKRSAVGYTTTAGLLVRLFL